MRSVATVVLCTFLFQFTPQQACADSRPYFIVNLKKEAALINRLETADAVLQFMSAIYGKVRTLEVRNYLGQIGIDVKKSLPKLTADQDRLFLSGVTGFVQVVSQQGGRGFTFVLPNGASFAFDNQRSPKENMKRVLALWKLPRAKASSLRQALNFVITEANADEPQVHGDAQDSANTGAVLLLFAAVCLAEGVAGTPHTATLLSTAALAGAVEEGARTMKLPMDKSALALIPQTMNCGDPDIKLVMKDGTAYVLHFDGGRPANLTISNASGNVGEFLLSSRGDDWKISGQQQDGMAANDQVPANSAQIISSLKDLTKQCAQPDGQKKVDAALATIQSNFAANGTAADGSPPGTGLGNGAGGGNLK